MSGSKLVPLSLHWSPGCEIIPSLSTFGGRRGMSLVETVTTRPSPKETRARWIGMTLDICTGTTGAWFSCPFDFPEVRRSVFLEPWCALWGTDQRFHRVRNKSSAHGNSPWWHDWRVSGSTRRRMVRHIPSRREDGFRNVTCTERPSTQFRCGARLNHCPEDGRA